MKSIPHKSKMRYLLGNNPSGELVKVISNAIGKKTINKKKG